MERYIRNEVKKLYPDAQPPEFHFIHTTEAELVFDYKRTLYVSCLLEAIEGYARTIMEHHFVEMIPQNDEQSVVRFNLKVES